MKLGEARQITSQRLNVLSQRKRELTKILKGETPGGATTPHFDRVELSKALDAVETEYEQTQEVAEKLNVLDNNIQNAEIARQQSEAAAEAAEEILKILEVFRRISKGDRVPPTDERKLMEYSQEMYIAAKNMALMNRNREAEEHDSLWEEEPAEEEPVEPAELAANTEVGNPLAGVTSSAGGSEAPRASE